jgi:hypothetical protein
MDMNAKHMRGVLNRIDRLLQSNPTTSKELFIVNGHEGSDDLVEWLAILHTDQQFLDYAIHTQDDMCNINRLVACMMSEYIENYHFSGIGSGISDEHLMLRDITSKELNLLIAIVFRQPTRVTKSVLRRLFSIAWQYMFWEPVRMVLGATMDDNGMKYVNPFQDDMDTDDATDGVDSDFSNEILDYSLVDIKIHNKSDDMIERLGELHLHALFHNCTVQVTGDNTLGMNKLMACMMSGIILAKFETDIGHTNSNTFDMKDVSLTDLQRLTDIAFRKDTSMYAPTLDRLIFIADEYDFHFSVCIKLWKTMYAHEQITEQLHISAIPEGFSPQKPIPLNMNGTLLNVRQIVPLLLNKIDVMVQGKVIGLGSLKWNARTLVNGRTYGVEYVEAAQMLAGLDPSAMHGYAPRGMTMQYVARETVAKVAYDLIEYGKNLALNGMYPEPETYFDPRPAYPVTAHGTSMNARRLVPFIINSMYASFVIKERLDGDRRNYLNPQIIMYNGKGSRWALDDPWVKEITDPDTKLYFDIAWLAFEMRTHQMTARANALYKQTLNGEKQGFYNPMWDLISFGTWLAYHERIQFIL